MAYFVVDTSILIEFLNPDNKVIQEFFIEHVPAIIIPYIAYYEFLIGARNKKEYSLYKKDSASIPVRH